MDARLDLAWISVPIYPIDRSVNTSFLINDETSQQRDDLMADSWLTTVDVTA